MYLNTVQTYQSSCCPNQLKNIRYRELSQQTFITFMLPSFQEIVKGDLVYMPFFFSVPFINGVVQVFTRSTLPRSDYHALWTLAKGTLIFQRNSTDMGGALSLTPWLKDVLPNYSGYNNLVKGNQVLLDFFSVRMKLRLDNNIYLLRICTRFRIYKLIRMNSVNGGSKRPAELIKITDVIIRIIKMGLTTGLTCEQEPC